VFLEAVDAGGFGLQWVPGASNLRDNCGHAVDLADPLVDVRLIFVDIALY
jgi:hypothetical protein